MATARPHVVVISDEGSPTVESVVNCVSSLGGEAHVLSAAQLPRDGRVAFDDNQPQLGVSGTAVPVEGCSGVWLWHPDGPVALDSDDATARYIRREWELVLSGFAAITPREIWINHPSAARWMESNKLEQMRLARNVGYDVPPTLLSNDPDRITAFAGRFETVAVKSQGGVWREHPTGEVETAYTQLTTVAELRGKRGSLARAPVMVQPYLAKAYELRVTVIDTTTFFCRIDSQASERTRIDWRRYDHERVAHELVEPSPDEREKVLDLVRAAGLRYAAIDLLCTPGGETYFLDLNPSGQFAWIEAVTGAPITRTLSGALLPA